MSGRNAGSYDPSFVQVSIGAPVGPLGLAIPAIPGLPDGVGLPWLVSGFAPDTFVTADRNVDGVTTLVGADGEGVNNISQDASGTITLTLMATSISNIVLSALHAAMTNKLVPVKFVFSVEITDLLSGSTFAFAPDCSVRKVATLERGATLGNNVWTINALNLEIRHGGYVF